MSGPTFASGHSKSGGRGVPPDHSRDSREREATETPPQSARDSRPTPAAWGIGCMWAIWSPTCHPRPASCPHGLGTYIPLHRSLVVPASFRPLISAADECSIAFISDHPRVYPPSDRRSFYTRSGKSKIRLPPRGGKSVVGYPSCQRNSPGLSSPPVRGRAQHGKAWKDFNRCYFCGRFTSAFKAAAVVTYIQARNGFPSSHRSASYLAWPGWVRSGELQTLLISEHHSPFLGPRYLRTSVWRRHERFRGLKRW